METNTDFSKYTITNIYSKCFPSNEKKETCFHNVNIKINDTDRIVNNCLVSSETIAEYYKFYNVNVPFHFANYNNLN
jgi:hypothetical protein